MTDVLVVGAGPTGLTLAAQLSALGTRVRIVDSRVEPRPSRAFIVQPRTLEVLAPLGVADTMIALGDASARVRVQAGRRAATIGLTRPGVSDTPYPFLLAIPQTTVERVLEEHLRRAGVTVEWGVRFTSLTQRNDAVVSVLEGLSGRPERIETAYVVGCDGADSSVRTRTGIAFPTREYRPAIVLADVTVDAVEPDTVHGFVDARGILFLFPSPDRTGWRLLTVIAGPPHAQRRPRQSDLAWLQAVTDEFTHGTVRLGGPIWMDTIRLRRGQAASYRRGRVLLAGDAAHVHSPAGAQGMNTGIQDACNLGWKLALAAAGTAGEPLLDSYETERRPLARRVRQLTDIAFLAEAADLPPLGLLRRYTVPVLLPFADRVTIPRWGFRLLGGLMIRYSHGVAAVEHERQSRHRLHAGHRLPDAVVTCGDGTRRLHDVVRRPGFHLLLCGDRAAFDSGAMESLRDRCGLPIWVHRLSRPPHADGPRYATGRKPGRLRGGASAVYLVRPDRYLGFCGPGTGLDGVASYLDGLSGAV
jgi:2-polyprenyl-6-methoxyphenol hydroxylase-like FAD-dependent oxidoreductase